jgi:hypothetical protein
VSHSWNQKCRPQVRKQSRAENLAEFDRVMDWLETLATPGPTSRFQTYRAKLSQAFRLLLRNRPDEILKQIPPIEFIEINFEANALIEVWRQFGTDNSQILATKLSRIVDGQPFTSSEGKKTEPRDLLFELELAALLKAWGLPVKLSDSTDLIFEFQNTVCLCECKRVQTPNGLSANIQGAGSQLGKAIKSRNDPSACLGIAGINVSKIVHLDASGLPRYLPTRYGDYLLPPDIVAVQHESQFGAAVHQRLESFIDQHINAFGRPVPEHVAGFILFYRVSGMDMSGTGRMFVNTYPKIGALRGANAAEDKLLRSLHSELLKNFL